MNHLIRVVAILTLGSTAAWAAANRIPPPETRRPADIRVLAKDTERSAGQFKKHFSKSLNDTIIDGTKREKQAKKAVNKLDSALNKVKGTAGKQKFKKSQKRVRTALKEAGRVDYFVSRLQLHPEVTDHWVNLRSNLDALAFYFDLRPVSAD